MGVAQTITITRLRVSYLLSALLASSLLPAQAQFSSTKTSGCAVVFKAAPTQVANVNFPFHKHVLDDEHLDACLALGTQLLKFEVPLGLDSQQATTILLAL